MNNLDQKNQFRVLQILFIAFSMSVLILLGLSNFVLCTSDQPANAAFAEISTVLFLIGLGMLLLVQFAWSNLLNSESTLFKKVIASQPDTHQKFTKFFTTTVILLGMTESAAILGFLIAFSSKCQDTTGLILMLGVLATYIIRFPKQSTLEDLIK